MSSIIIMELTIFLLLVTTGLATNRVSVVASNAADNNSTLQVNVGNHNDTVRYINNISIEPNIAYTINVTYTSSNASFYILQIHTFLRTVVLSYEKEQDNNHHNSSVSGSNIGLYIKPNVNNITQLFLRHSGIESINTLVVVTAYGEEAPIPGGCNMEFNTKIAPYLKVQTLPTTIVVEMQPSSAPLHTNASCSRNPVIHKMYQMYMNEQDQTEATYFSSIKKMLTVDDIEKHGQQVLGQVNISTMRRIFSAYTGTGSVYVAVVTFENSFATYVPVVSYGCDPVNDPESCIILKSGFPKFVCFCSFFIGFISLFVPLVLPATVPLFAATVLGYIITSNILIATLIGAGLGLLCGLRACAMREGRNLCNAFIFGWFIACVIYSYVPGTAIIPNNWYFWSIFVVIILTISLIKWCLMICTGGQLTNVIFGSFMMILPIDYSIGSCLKYIIINFVRRVQSADFAFAIIQPPIQSQDITLIVWWVILALLLLFQCIPKACSKAKSLSNCDYERIPSSGSNAPLMFGPPQEYRSGMNSLTRTVHVVTNVYRSIGPGVRGEN